MNNNGYQSSGYEASQSSNYPSSSSSSSGRTSPGPGDQIQVDWPQGGTSYHMLDNQNRLMTYAQQSGRWVRENDDSVAAALAAFASPVAQGGAGLASSGVGTGVGVALAAAPGVYKVGASAVQALRDSSVSWERVLGAAAGALQAGGAIAWGVGTAGAASTTTRDAGAIAHGVGAGAMALHSWYYGNNQQRPVQNDVESQYSYSYPTNPSNTTVSNLSSPYGASGYQASGSQTSGQSSGYSYGYSASQSGNPSSGQLSNPSASSGSTQSFHTAQSGQSGVRRR
ncbi:hypothetical protein [Micromonospora sp. NPDC023956]|uniref:hypothetical protein n=1 Tax=Micromonospora sp. NPDC023956 TaxID=3155722 RepID=UPI0033C615E8